MPPKKRPPRSDLDPSELTWGHVFALMGPLNEVEQAIADKLREMDYPPAILHGLIEGTHRRAVNRLVRSDAFFDKIESAVSRMNIPTKRSKIEAELPTASEYGKKRTLHKIPGICDHRHFSGLHTTLQVEAFGKFCDIMQSDDQLDLKFYETAACLMVEMSKEFQSEAARKTAFLSIVSDIFAPTPSEEKCRGKGKSDSTASVSIQEEEHYLANLEFKNEMVDISSEPFFENESYFVHFQKGVPGRNPMLLVNVVGCHYIQVFGASWNGGNVCIDPLCSPLSLLYVPRDPVGGVAKVARLLSAYCSTVSELQQYLLNLPMPIKGPYYNSDGRLQDMKRMTENYEWVFEARYERTTVVVVKFVRSYGKDVHQLLANNNLAPQLYDVTILCGGWQAVVMEKVGGTTAFAKQDQLQQGAIRDLKKAVRLMHQNNYVHGDLHPQNIQVIDNSVRILDFDWAGEIDTVRYPYALDMGNSWHSDVQPGGLIFKDHDIFQLESYSN